MYNKKIMPDNSVFAKHKVDDQAEVEEWNAAVERGDPEHAAAMAELARRWEAKGWRIVPGERPGDPPRGMRVAGLGGATQ